jgi:hypothetical protein
VTGEPVGRAFINRLVESFLARHAGAANSDSGRVSATGGRR